MKAFIAVLLTAALAFAGGHAATISTMEIETDGDCDSAFVTTLGREYFMGANGYEVDRPSENTHVIIRFTDMCEPK